jgi:hypothetical protein
MDFEDTEQTQPLPERTNGPLGATHPLAGSQPVDPQSANPQRPKDLGRPFEGAEQWFF